MSAFRMVASILVVAISVLFSGIPASIAQETGEKIDKNKLKRETRSFLDGSTWELEITQPGSSKKSTDTLTFKGRTVTSENLSKDGYNTSNFSLMVQDDGVAIWQTMQVSEKKGSAFWRGELHGENKEQMYGMLSIKPTPDTSTEYAFRATKIGGQSIEEAVVVAAAEAVAEAEAKAARAVREAAAAEAVASAKAAAAALEVETADAVDESASTIAAVVEVEAATVVDETASAVDEPESTIVAVVEVETADAVDESASTIAAVVETPVEVIAEEPKKKEKKGWFR